MWKILSFLTRKRMTPLGGTVQVDSRALSLHISHLIISWFDMAQPESSYRQHHSLCLAENDTARPVNFVSGEIDKTDISTSADTDTSVATYFIRVTHSTRGNYGRR